MSRSLEELAGEIRAAAEEKDLEKLDALANCFRATEQPASLPLSAAIEFDPDQVDVAAIGANESEVAIGFANSFSRARRRAKYELDRLGGVRRPVIVSEGDSWFQYPVRLDDVIDQLVDEHGYQIYSLGKAGDLLALMIQEREYVRAIESEQADFFLISGGGNDMLGGGRLRHFLRDWTPDASPRELLHQPRWEAFLAQISDLYQSLFQELTSRYPSLTILCHGYDYVIPRADGKWLGTPMTDRGVPRQQHKAVAAVLIDDFNAQLARLAGEFAGRVHHVDCRNTVGGPASWDDELHPKNAGYGRVAGRFAAVIENAWDARSHLSSDELSAAAPRDVSETVTPLQQIGAKMAANDIANPVLGQMRLASQDTVANEAIIRDPYRATAAMLASQSTPKIPAGTMPSTQVPTLGREGQLKSDASNAELTEDVVLMSQIIRGVTDSVMSGNVEQLSMIQDDNGTPPPSDEELRRRPPCESLEVWQAHLRRDPENLIAYEDYRRVKEDYDRGEDERRLQLRRSLMPVAALALQERILGESDLFQINFLSRGVQAAKAVGRITAFNQFDISLGSGTGFLVAPGLLLTNNHVLESAAVARHSHVLFEYEYDERNHLKTTEQFDLTDEIFCTSASHDFTFVSVRPTGNLGNSLEIYSQLQLIRQSGKAVKGEPISIIQHADGLPKQLAIRNSRIVGRARQFIYYTTDTNPGSSGAPVTNDQWFPVALHHRSVPHYFEKCSYVANRGIRISAIYEELERQSEAGSTDASSVLSLIEPSPSEREVASSRVGGLDGGVLERNIEPFHEVPYDNRTGYDADFLGLAVPMPEVVDPATVAAPLLPSGSSPEYELKYEHFSVVMNRHRRLAMVTAANVDFSREAKRPGSRPRSDYNRSGLSGLGRNDKEKWFLDPRLASEFQIPDRFYNKDRKAFHKGHVVRRDAVAWGHTYEEMRRANGDTYHVTNCSPQVGHFNSALQGGIWGRLENEIGRQGRAEKLCVFAGPLLSDQDREFRGFDDSGEIILPIPSIFWKVVVARSGTELQVFAFWLQQNLNEVAFEFTVSGEWRTRQISLGELQRKLRNVVFDQRLHDADQLRR